MGKDEEVNGQGGKKECPGPTRSQRAVTSCGWGVKAGMVRVWVAGKLCDPPVTHGPYLSTLEIKDL